MNQSMKGRLLLLNRRAHPSIQGSHTYANARIFKGRNLSGIRVYIRIGHEKTIKGSGHY